MNDKPSVEALLKQAAESHLWGSIQLDFQNGQLVLVRRTETIKVGRENNRYERKS
jgi:hypothetical protein